MCTLIVAFRVFPNQPVWIAANRDESLDRPFLPPARMSKQGVSMLAPLDQKAAGTWLGVNQYGLFAGITNRFGNPPDPARPSRGKLVFDALAHRSAAESSQRLASLTAQEHNCFHLLLLDRDAGWVVVNDGQQVQHYPLLPGFFVLTERSYGAGQSDRAQWLNQQLVQHTQQLEDPLYVKQLLSTHAEWDPFARTCVHVPWLNYGTRCSTLLALGQQSHFSFCNGPPCQNEFQDLGLMLQELGL